MPAVPVVGQTFTFGVQLRSQANANLYVVAPALQAADFRISINGGGYDPLDNLPTVSPAGGDQVVIVVAAAETTAAGAGGHIHIDWKDDAGAVFYPDYAELIVHATDLDSLATATSLATVDGIVDSILLDTGTDGVVISTATAQEIADELLKRGVSNVEDTADAHSLATIILAALESSLSGDTWTIKKTGGTTFTTKTVTTNAAADPITAVT